MIGFFWWFDLLLCLILFVLNRCSGSRSMAPRSSASVAQKDGGGKGRSGPGVLEGSCILCAAVQKRRRDEKKSKEVMIGFGGVSYISYCMYMCVSHVCMHPTLAEAVKRYAPACRSSALNSVRGSGAAGLIDNVLNSNDRVTVEKEQGCGSTCSQSLGTPGPLPQRIRRLQRIWGHFD